MRDPGYFWVTDETGRRSYRGPEGVIATFAPVTAPSLEGEWWSAQGSGQPWPVLVRFGVKQGRLACTGLAILPESEEEVTAGSLRQLRLGELLEQYGRAPMSDIPSAFDSAVKVRAVPRVVTKDTIRRAAELYNGALRDDEHCRAPVAWVAEQMDPVVSTQTVRRWLREAERLGLVGRTQPGKPRKVKRQRKGS